MSSKSERLKIVERNDYFIAVDGVSKAYEMYSRPIDRLKQMVLPKLRRILRLPQKKYYDTYWALKEVSFNIKKGETVGIIGLNGSGKSTLLQIICGTLSQTEGSVHVNGRVAALLELGSGFNPEFSGKENVYMNATILGLSEKQIDERFHKIVEFADIGEFIDHPVKTYSSGMAVRLAFAVIAHVDADILVVDEALAVGDAVFTQKCMRFIRRFQKDGTLLFVSHDTSTVINLCKSAVWLSDGSVVMHGPSKTVGEEYLQYTLQKEYGDDVELRSISGSESASVSEDYMLNQDAVVTNYKSSIEVRDNLQLSKGWDTGVAEILSVSIDSYDGAKRSFFEGGERVVLSVQFQANRLLQLPIIGFLWRDKLGQDLFGENTLPHTDISPKQIDEHKMYKASFDFVLPMLPNGQYSVCATLGEGDLYDHVQYHWLHEALVVTVSSAKIRWGLVGVPFNDIKIDLVNC